ncbi:hypothetical protein CDL12_22332 [Handroanthus impetiginosus]|uniref:DUF1685 domain-containing protein n=1 Tax=Handroanthus impetiginosus TaxID=429701 RepID=A0A2G9GIV9_9LAMI|nr:hypothetical protein CDL12_22332 [Handroanthus impetiginosus]
MEPEAVLNLFDSYWYHLKIFENQPKTSTSSTFEPNPVLQTEENPSKNQNFSRQLTINARSKSDDLQSILLEREISVEIPKPPEFNKPSKVFNKKKNRLSKSLSELEFEEVKGFMDLGFVFSEEDKDSSLVEIIPGLQKLGLQRDDTPGKKEEIRRSEELSGLRARPYLSEAWEVLNVREKEESPLLKWRFPVVSNEIDMKASLKWWAHSVADTVR